jgi:hypothetical protein
MGKMSRLPSHVETVVTMLRQGQGDDRPAGDCLADVDWEAALAFANQELVTPELHAAINSAGLGDRLPPDVGAYLAYLHDLNRTRNERMREQLIDVIKVWNDAGLVPLVLKSGVALLTEGGAMSDRMVMDLDFLFDPSEAGRAVRTAESLGSHVALAHARALGRALGQVRAPGVEVEGVSLVAVQVLQLAGL